MKRRIKKLASLLLAGTMVLSMAACGNSGGESAGDGSTEAADNGSGSSGSGSSASDDGLTGHYTYSFSDSAPSTWSPTDWENTSEANVLEYTCSGLYEFVKDETGTGYEVQPALAAALPEDVTAEYAGNETYGVPADATEGYAWKVTLNPDACWEDGAPITAADWEYTLQQFLNPEMANYRAASYYSGNCGLANAYGYYKSAYAGEMAYGSTLADLGFASVEEAEAAGYTDFGVDLANFWGISEAGIVSVTDETEYRDEAVDEGADEDYVSGKYIYETYLAAGAPYESYAADYVYVGEIVEGATWDEVGFEVNDDYTITFILSNPTSLFYFEYGIGVDLFLVNEELYEANKKTEGDLVKSSYGTSVDSYAATGPYKITEYQADKYMKLEKNENWFGWTDSRYEGMYQTTDIYVQYIDEHSTEMSLFLQGKLSVVGLDSADIETYANSDYLYYTPQSYTSKLTFNGDLTMLQQEDGDGVNHSIISYEDFRHAVSLALDRDAFCATCTAGHEAGYGIINYLYTADPETGKLYRDYDAAKQTLCTFYGAEDESDITGYDKDAASALFQSAYESALADGLMTETDTVEIDFHLYGSDEGYVRIVNFVQDAITAATVGTGLEGKVTVNLVADENYYDNMKAGTVDLAFDTWGGSSMDPFGITECYCTDAMKNQYSFHPDVETLTITLDGEELTKTYLEWHEALNSGEYANADIDTKVEILAAMELGWLNTYTMIPLYYRNSAGMYSQRTILGSETYMNSILEYGGVAYMTYTMDDAEWEAYCADNNNQLTY